MFTLSRKAMLSWVRKVFQPDQPPSPGRALPELLALTDHGASSKREGWTYQGEEHRSQRRVN
jgi:hypothetical protein